MKCSPVTTILLCLTALSFYPVVCFSSPRGVDTSSMWNSRGGSKVGILQQQRKNAGRLFSSSTDTKVDKALPKKQEKEKVEEETTSSIDNDKASSSRLAFFKSMDGIVFQAYLCNVVALSLPVILLPMAATEQIASGVVNTSAKVASTVAAVSSIATLGGAVGKFANGFICKQAGSYRSSQVYLFGLGISSLLFSMSPNAQLLGISYASMEFFASMQWASLSVMLSNYYSNDKLKLAAALTTLGLSSTTGMILAKTLGTTLCTTFHWRSVARFGAIMAMVGSLIISQAPGKASAKEQGEKVPLLQSIQESLQAILTSKLFWLLGLAHSMAFCTRGTERILGTFYHAAAGLPQSIAGGLTLSITFGLVYGLVTGSKKFSALSGNATAQKQFLASRYRKSFAATVGLALAASPIGASILKGSSILSAAVIALLSGTMIANVAFQYYQFPAMIAKEFGKHKAVCISWLDGFGFLLSAPIFATCAKLVPTQGWSSAWGMLAVLFGLAGALMVKSITPVLESKQAA